MKALVSAKLLRLKRVLRQYLYGPFGIRRLIVPVSSSFGFDRGRPIDRHYIEQFLETHRESINGTVLEIGDREYTKAFGGDAVVCSEVLHARAGNPEATIIGDLISGEGIRDNVFDCMILTQTLPFIYDARQAVVHCMRGLKPGGVLLATLPGISQISRYDMERWGDYWRFTDASARRLFGDVFGTENVEIETHGNVLVACALLYGLATHELSVKELDVHDQDYQVIVTVCARKPAEQ